MKNQEYIIGLDIGTASVGYAMTDTNGVLLKHKKRSTFGAVCFDEASTAKNRRDARSERRRLDRKEQRIDLLQEILSKDIANVDDTFFIKLNESFLQEDDSKYPNVYGTLPPTLWADGAPDDKAETRQTIYHLRHTLATVQHKADIRYIYLALHHIIKYRGHFIYEGHDLTTISTGIAETLTGILEYFDLPSTNQVSETIVKILQKKEFSAKARADAIRKELNVGNGSTAMLKSLSALFVGNQGSLLDLFGYEGNEPAAKICFSNGWDSEPYSGALDDEAFKTLCNIYEVYRWQMFADLSCDGKTISEIMIHRYNTHKEDLKRLKSWTRKYAKDNYNKMFRAIAKEGANYCNYIGRSSDKRLKQDEFYKAVKKLLTSNKETSAQTEAKPMLDAIEMGNNSFMPLLRINYNAVIPYQLHAQELRMILERQSVYYPTLKDNLENIMLLCTFRLPYYVGPLNSASPFQTWLVRKSDGKITPWNFSEKIDKLKTAEGFIGNLTNKCTYLPGKDVLPLNSILYQDYLLLDELNCMRINGELIGTDLRDRMIDGLFKAEKKAPTKNMIIHWLRENDLYYRACNTINIDGLHGENGCLSCLRTYYDFTHNDFEINESTIPMIENIVRWSTVFENRTILREKVSDAYPELTEKQLNFICRRKYDGWGRLSRELLDGIYGDNLAENCTIIDMMRLTNHNFMQIIKNDKYGFNKAIEEAQTGMFDGKLTYEKVSEMYGSPAIKRGIWQAVRIVEELVKHQGHAPKAIYIENTREDDNRKKGRRTDSRISKLTQAYSQAQDNSFITDDARQRLSANRENQLSDMQFLYLLQGGMSMYSSRSLNFDRLSEECEIDHIIPQSLIKDDSIDNRVLVFTHENQCKHDGVISQDVRRDMQGHWRRLHDIGLISDKKLRNLNKDEFTERDIRVFTNRQLVQTSQIIKAVTTLFRVYYPDTIVHGINARLSSQLREMYDLPKVRELNNSHHAFDALLACTIGLFSDRYLHWYSDERSAACILRRQWQRSVSSVIANRHDRRQQDNDEYGLVLGMFRRNITDPETGALLWDAEEHKQYLIKSWAYRDHFFAYKKFEKTGAFYNETRYPVGSTDAKIPLRKNLPVEKYGGFGKIEPAYIAAIEYDFKGTRKSELINVPAYLVSTMRHDTEAFNRWASDQGYVNFRLLRKKILLNQHIEYKGSLLLMRSASEAWNCRELYLRPSNVRLLNKIYKERNKLCGNDIPALFALFEEIIEKLKFYPRCENIYKELDKTRKCIRNGISNAQECISMPKNDAREHVEGTENDTSKKKHSVQDLIVLITETIKYMQVNDKRGEFEGKLEGIKISKYQGRLNHLPFDLSKIYLIERSVTGFYERKVPLWDSEQS